MTPFKICTLAQFPISISLTGSLQLSEAASQVRNVGSPTHTTCNLQSLNGVNRGGSDCYGGEGAWESQRIGPALGRTLLYGDLTTKRRF